MSLVHSTYVIPRCHRPFRCTTPISSNFLHCSFLIQQSHKNKNKNTTTIRHTIFKTFTTTTTTDTSDITSALTKTDRPFKSIVPPGKCQFSDKFIPVPLLAKFHIPSTSSYILRFGLPNKNEPVGLSTCSCLLAGIQTDDSDEMIVRPYTPISTNAMIGSFDLLVKAYPDGKMSSHITSLTADETKPVVSFKHIPFNVKIQYPFRRPKFIGMIAGGTGITPMIQALHAILGSEEESDQDTATTSKLTETTCKVSLLYGSRTVNDILGKDMLDAWCKLYPDKLSLTHVISQGEKEEKDTTFINEDDSTIQEGFINQQLIEQTFPSPNYNENSGNDGLTAEDIKIFVCGPPAMYDALCGPRDEDNISGLLAEMGYTSEQVYKF